MSEGLAGRAASIVILFALVALSAKLALAPINGTGNVDGCVRAYAKAHTHVDTIAVDFKSYPAGGTTQRCGYGVSVGQVSPAAR